MLQWLGPTNSNQCEPVAGSHLERNPATRNAQGCNTQIQQKNKPDHGRVSFVEINATQHIILPWRKNARILTSQS
jgi:hypothetical protein